MRKCCAKGLPASPISLPCSTPAKRLSAGQRRRLGLAWLLLRRPETWLLDEPYATLDDEGRTFFDELIGDVVKSGASVIATQVDADVEVIHVILMGVENRSRERGDDVKAPTLGRR